MSSSARSGKIHGHQFVNGQIMYFYQSVLASPIITLVHPREIRDDQVLSAYWKQRSELASEATDRVVIFGGNKTTPEPQPPVDTTDAKFFQELKEEEIHVHYQDSELKTVNETTEIIYKDSKETVIISSAYLHDVLPAAHGEIVRQINRK